MPRSHRRAGWTAPDRLLVGGVLAVCVAAHLLHLSVLVSGDLGWLPFTLERRGEGAARVATLRTDLPAAWRGRIAPGDGVRRAGDVDLEGRGGLDAAARLYAATARAGGRLQVERVRGGETRQVELGLVPIPAPWRTSIVALSFLGVGALAWYRAPRRRAARLFFLAAAGYALHWSYFFGGASLGRSLAGMAALGAGVGLAMPFALGAALAFPEDAARRGALARGGPWLFAAVGAGAMTWAFGGPLPAALGAPLAVGGSVLFFLVLGGVLLDQWRRTGPIGRRQLKWVLLGAMAAFVPPLLAGLAALAQPGLAWLYEVSLVALVLLPVGIFVALARDHLFDVDRLLTAASATSLLAALFLAGVILLVPRVAQATGAILDPAVSQPALAVLAAFGVLAARSRVTPWVERTLFPERAALEAGAEALRRDLDASEKPAELFRALGEGLADRLRATHVIVYGHAGPVFAPLFERGGAVAPVFDATGPLAELLDAEPRIVDLGGVELALARDPAAEPDRAALEAMGTELVLPVAPGGRLEAFVCLGEKASGQGYGASELVLLQGAADKASDVLRRFDLEQVHRAQAEMNRRLRRYVPDAVAQRLAERSDMPAGEVEVSVLFVDLRGYTALAEARGPEATFDLVSRYTRTVSEGVRRHGGAVVDFQGDGLMAVFGAPEPHAAKERAAVAAARELAAAVRALPVDAADPEAGGPELGIGVATGRAFAGPVRSVERTLWCVLGDTTNLAARLQALGKELGATIVIDDATRRGAGPEARDFVAHSALPVRGRHGRVDVHVLPRATEASPRPVLEEASP